MPFYPTILKPTLDYDWFFATGLGTGTQQNLSSTTDVHAVRSSSSILAGGWPINNVLTTGNFAEFFDGDHANFNANYIFFVIPMLHGNYQRGVINVWNNLGVNLDVTVYDIVRNSAFQAANGPITWRASYGHGTSTFTLTDTQDMSVAMGTIGDDFNTNQMSFHPVGGEILLRVKPASDPAANTYWSLSVGRAK